MSAIDWGSVPAWFSAVGTTGALGITSFIIARDRRVERRKDPERVVCRVEEFNEHVMGVNVHNTSDRPVYGTTVLASTDGEFDDPQLAARREGLCLRMIEVLNPDTEDNILIPFTKDREPPRILGVQFRDVHGTQWVHDLEDHSLRTVSGRQIRRALRRLSPEVMARRERRARKRGVLCLSCPRR